MSNAIVLDIDPDELTIGDLEDFEEITGGTIQKVIKTVPELDANGDRVFDEKGRPVMTSEVPAKAIRALVWITQRKLNPEFTLEDARNVRVSSLVLHAPSEDEQGND
jgi:hypothetical protein